MGASTARDEGLRRISGLTRAVVAGAVVVTGGFTALVARTLPGKSSAQNVSTTNPSGNPSGNPPASPAGGDEPQLDDPASPPSTTVSPSTTIPSFGNSRPLLPPSRPPRAGSGSGRAVSGSS